MVRVSLLGNCTVHMQTDAVPRHDGNFDISGTVQMTTADQNTTLIGVVIGSTSPDPSGNPLFGNFHYDVSFTGGTGLMDDALGGGADINGFGHFAEDFANGKATWILPGHLISQRNHDRVCDVD